MFYFLSHLKKVFCCAALAVLLAATAVVQAATVAPQADAILKKYESKRDLTDWEAIVLGINGRKIKTPWFSTPYFKRLEKEITKNKGEYRLVTDYARIVLVYKSHGKDPTQIVGYDFIEKIKTFDKMQNQGVNAYIWALIALYGQDEAITSPLIEKILSYRLTDGGFGLTAKAKRSDVDITAMAVTAIAPYAADAAVQEAVEGAVQFLADAQAANGGYIAGTGGDYNAESVSQVIIALCAVGVDINDPRFVKYEKNLLDVLAVFRLNDGQYAHVQGDKAKADPIATRQAALAIRAYQQAAAYEAATPEERAASGIKRGIYELG